MDIYIVSTGTGMEFFSDAEEAEKVYEKASADEGNVTFSTVQVEGIYSEDEVAEQIRQAIDEDHAQAEAVRQEMRDRIAGLEATLGENKEMLVQYQATTLALKKLVPQNAAMRNLIREII